MPIDNTLQPLLSVLRKRIRIWASLDSNLPLWLSFWLPDGTILWLKYLRAGLPGAGRNSSMFSILFCSSSSASLLLYVACFASRFSSFPSISSLFLYILSTRQCSKHKIFTSRTLSPHLRCLRQKKHRKGYVTFVVSVNADSNFSRVRENQSDSVNIRTYKTRDVLSFSLQWIDRWFENVDHIRSARYSSQDSSWATKNIAKQSI